MVIISTSATEVSIQAVSPELGVHFSRTAFFGSGSLAQAGGGAAGAGGGGAGAAPGEARAVRPRAPPRQEPVPERRRRHTSPRSGRGRVQSRRREPRAPHGRISS